MCVVSHGYGGFGGGRDGVAVGRHAGQSQEALVGCRKMPEHFQNVRWRHL